jgi:hypothetical protein
MCELLGLSPGAAREAKIAAVAAVAAGSLAASAFGVPRPAQQLPPPAQAPPAAQCGTKRPAESGKAPAAAPVKAAKRSGGSGSLDVLSSGRRGELVVVQPSATYAAGKSYFWDDVVAVARLLEGGKITLKDLDKKKPDGDLLYRVPRTTMTKWLTDDYKQMASSGKRGLQGVAHWKVELEVRGRTELSKAGAKPVRCRAQRPMHCSPTPRHRASAARLSPSALLLGAPSCASLSPCPATDRR